MILNLYMENLWRKRQNKWWFTLNNTNEVVARAVNGVNTHTYLWYGKNKYQFNDIPKSIMKKELDFKYPYSSKIKKTIGYRIFENEKLTAEFHWDALRCKDTGVNKNIGLNIFHFNDEVYLLFHVGLPKHKSSYYCLYQNGGELIAIIARHHTGKAYDNCKATLYIDNDENLLITLFACTSQIVDVINFWDEGENHDPSAGPVISTLEAERELFDAEFIEKVKKQVSSKSLLLPLEIPAEDLQLATEMVDSEKEEKQEKKLNSKIRMALLLLIIVYIVTTILKLLGRDLVFYF